jgi:hypothetical protein
MTIERYRQFKRRLKETPFKGQYMPYDWDDLPRSLPFTWLAYSQMLDEYAREIANSINALSDYTHRLTAWRDVVSPLDENKRIAAAHDFIDPLATVALNLPYAIRSRFIFAAAHLCHQVNRERRGKDWKDDLPVDSGIYFDVADKVGTAWKLYGPLKARLQKISARDFQRNSGDFRHAYNHRFSPHVIVGHTQFLTRNVDPATKSVQYGFGGGRPPLTLETVVPLLEQQCMHCYRAFEAFQKLVREHALVIKSQC